MYQSFVGVYYLLQVDGFVAIVRKGCVFVEVLISLDNILYWSCCLDDCSAENATSEVAAIGDEVDICIQITLNLFQRLTNLGYMLMLEGLVDAQVVVAPREMGRSSWLLTSTSRTGNGIDGYIFFQ